MINKKKIQFEKKKNYWHSVFLTPEGQWIQWIIHHISIFQFHKPSHDVWEIATTTETNNPKHNLATKQTPKEKTVTETTIWFLVFNLFGWENITKKPHFFKQIHCMWVIIACIVMYRNHTPLAIKALSSSTYSFHSFVYLLPLSLSLSVSFCPIL